MDARTIVQKHFLKPFAADGRNHIGVELEFPLVRLSNEPVEQQFALRLLEHMLGRGFRTAEYGENGQPAFLTDGNGDYLSFDNSYHNFEFSMEKGSSLSEQEKRFSRLFTAVQEFLLPHGYLLCGMGTNPYAPHNDSLPVSYPVYGMVRRFLGQFYGEKYHTLPEFPAYLSSVQTHLDVPLAHLPRALTLFAAMDFVRALLFSNAPAVLNGFDETVCFRDYMWEKSGFGSLHANVGKVNGEFRTGRDIEDFILSRSMFHRIRNGKYELISPVTVEEYFSRADSPEDDIKCYLSFQNVEITRRGTLEIRSDCQQPVGEGFCAPAFHLGILHRMKDAEQLLYGFMERCLPKAISEHPRRNQILRDGVIYHYSVPAPKSELQKLLLSLVQLTHSGLTARGLGEERLLTPLFLRAEKLTCPAKEQKKLAERGMSKENIIQAYSLPKSF